MAADSYKETIDRIVREIFAERLPKIERELLERVSELASSALAKTASPAPAEVSASDCLNAAMASIYDSSVQADILRALLDALAQFCGRIALFVNRSGTLKGWQARGFTDNEGIKAFTVDSSKGLPRRTLRDKTPVAAAAQEFDAGFVGANGPPSDGNAWLLPLLVKDKVPALLYADIGTEPGAKLDISALQLLVRAAGTWIEVVNSRKAGVSEVGSDTGLGLTLAPSAATAEVPAATQATTTAAPTTTPTEASRDGAVAEEQEIHKKARRFAKLLVDEIKLYNPAKVKEGKQNKDLYKRLREDIDKSRATYEKRYGSTAAGQAKYFEEEVIRILADNDSSLMGAGFSK